MTPLWLCGNRWTGLTIAGRSNPGFYGIARNVWRKHCAGRLARGIDPPESAPEEPDPEPSPMQTLLSKETGCMLEEAVAQLSPEYREAVVLRFWEDLDYGEISEALAISEGLARWRVYQARKMLLRKLSRAGLTTEQLFRSGAKFGWWLRLHKRPGPPLQLLDRCIATIPHIEPLVGIRQREEAESKWSAALLRGTDTDLANPSVSGR